MDLYYFACIFLKGYLTDEVGCACEDVEPPHNNNGSWAAVVKYNNHGDCGIDHKVTYLLHHKSVLSPNIILLSYKIFVICYFYTQIHSVMEAGYLMVLLVSSQECNFDGKECIVWCGQLILFVMA